MVAQGCETTAHGHATLILKMGMQKWGGGPEERAAGGLMREVYAVGKGKLYYTMS